MLAFLKETSLSKFAVNYAVVISSLVAFVLSVWAIVAHFKWVQEEGVKSMLPISIIVSYVIILIIVFLVFVLCWALLLLIGHLSKRLTNDTKWWQTALASLVLAIVLVICTFFLERWYLTKKIANAQTNEELEIVAAKSFVIYEARLLDASGFYSDIVPIAKKIASSPQVSPNLLQKLSTIDSFSVKKSVAENPNTPHEVLEVLLAERNAYGHNGYIMELAKNPGAPNYIFEAVYNYATERMSKDRNAFYYTEPEALKNLLENPSVSESLKEKVRMPYIVE